MIQNPRKDELALFGISLLVTLVVIEYGFVSFVYQDTYLYLALFYCIIKVGDATGEEAPEHEPSSIKRGMRGGISGIARTS